MAYKDVQVVQYGVGLLDLQSAPYALTLTGVTAGSMLVLVGEATCNSGSDTTAILSSVSDSKSNTWGSVTNTRTSGSYSPNTFCAVAHNVAAGDTTVTASFNKSALVDLTWAVFEISNALTASAIAEIVTGTASATTTTSTSATGTLAQTDNLLIGIGGGWHAGTPTVPVGWSTHLTQVNGAGGYVGAVIGSKKITATDPQTFTISHLAGSATSALMVVIKAAEAGAALRYKFLLNPSTLTSADTNITGYVWRNGAPETSTAEKYTGLAGSATAGTLYIDSGLPASVSLSDTIVGSFYSAAGDGSRPFVAGVVEEA